MEIVRRTNNHHIGLPHPQHLPKIRVGWHKASTIKILKPTLMKRAACFAGIAQSNKLTRLPVGVRDRIDKHRDAGTGADDCEFAFWHGDRLGSVTRGFPAALQPWVKRGENRNHNLLFSRYHPNSPKPSKERTKLKKVMSRIFFPDGPGCTYPERFVFCSVESTKNCLK